MKHFPLSILLVIAIWIVCMIPVPETPLREFSLIDKWTHFVMYGVLAITVWTEYYLCKRRMRKSGEDEGLLPHIAIVGMVGPVVMGCLVELAQAYLTTYRSGDILDALCNSLGILLGSIIGLIIKRALR